MPKDSTGLMMNQVMSSFQQQFGKLCAEQLSVWEKVCLCRGMWRILLGAVDQYPKQWPVLRLPLSLNDHHTSPCGNNQCNLGYYIGPCLTTRGTWWWSCFGQWHETMSQSMCVVVGMISDSLVSWKSSIFRWMCSLLQLPILKCFLGLNRIFVTCLRCRTTHHTWW